MIESALIPDLLKLLVSTDTLEKIDTDPMLSVMRYNLVPEGVLGTMKQLCIATNSKKLFAPNEPHQMLAKGIVYLKHGSIHYANPSTYELIAFPYTKIYNSFEGPAVRDAMTLSARSDIIPKPQIMRKYDGTLIARWVYEGKVYFSTRGRIISIEKNEFYDLTMKVIEKKGYHILLDPSYATEATIIMELIGPSNVILEMHSEDDLVVTGVYSLHKNVYVDPTKTSIKDTGLHIAEVYDATSPEDVLASFNTIQEGVIVNTLKWDNTAEQNVIISRIKYKSEDYINLLKATNSASKENLLELALEHGFSEWDDVEKYFLSSMADHPYREELLNIYKEEWIELYPCLVDIYKLGKSFLQSAIVAAGIPVRKDRFFWLKENVDDKYAGLLMQIVDGKKTERDLLIALARESCQ